MPITNLENKEVFDVSANLRQYISENLPGYNKTEILPLSPTIRKASKFIQLPQTGKKCILIFMRKKGLKK